ncbi:hypothetical protein FE257_004986 [Aspergillus nanangensis]|uniref:Saposin B-type domain-containing protein n=1 Tax=Aspergillus nanangensis TaxID=2582783 RepID=A0AAD4CR42_ASPNN|nr:hypothetical protein FE257_004986 [Aspergillus nanangensis]
MKFPRISIILSALCLFLLGGGIIFFYAHRPPPEARDRDAYCASCISYASRIDRMIQHNPDVRGNKGFFRYAVDVSCRGALLASHRCPSYRRSFLKDSNRFMYEIENHLEACQAIRAC